MFAISHLPGGEGAGGGGSPDRNDPRASNALTLPSPSREREIGERP